MEPQGSLSFLLLFLRGKRPVATRVLIVGLNPFDSGKTGAAIQIIQSLSENHKVEFFKPVSGHNYWYRFEHTRYCLDNRKLVSYDATRVRQVLRSTVHDFLANPVHVLYAPAHLQRPGENLTSTLGLAGWDSVLVMQRMSHPLGNGVQSTMLIAKDLIQKGRLLVTPEEAARLSEGTTLQAVTRLEEVQKVENDCFETFVGESFKELEKASDIVVIESFNDSVWPWEGLDKVDIVLAVGPGHVFSYEPERFRRASVLVKLDSVPIREVTFGRIADLLKPIRKVALLPAEGLTDEAVREMGVF